MKTKEIIFIVLLLISLVGAVYLVRNRQMLQRGAFFSRANILLQPSERIEKKVGEDVVVRLFVDSPVGTRINNVHSVICYDNHISLPTDVKSAILINTNSGFDASPIAVVKPDGDRKCLTLVATSLTQQDESMFKDGMNQVATITFDAVAVGEGNIDIDVVNSKIAGVNPGQTDLAIEIGDVTNTLYKITEADGTTPTVTVEPTDPVNPTNTIRPTNTVNPTNTVSPTEGETSDGLVLNYKMSFDFVRPGYDNCAIDWPVKITVLSGGTSRTYTDVPDKTTEKVAVTKNGVTTELIVFRGRVELTGFSSTQNVAVFIKGPKHLQMKYGKDNQTSYYNQQGGEISLADNNTVHNFSKYPLMAGDVVGVGNNNQDGIINGADFTYVKQKVITNANYDAGHYELADLDGNCSMKSKDMDLVRESLNEKQSQLY